MEPKWLKPIIEKPRDEDQRVCSYQEFLLYTKILKDRSQGKHNNKFKNNLWLKIFTDIRAFDCYI